MRVKEEHVKKITAARKLEKKLAKAKASDDPKTKINKVVGLKSMVGYPFFAFIPGVIKFVVTSLMSYLPGLISTTITKMIIQNAKIMGTELFTKIIGIGSRFLTDKYIMPFLI